MSKLQAMRQAKVTLDDVLELLTKEKFAKWYAEEGRFGQWLTGEDQSLINEDILKDLAELFGLNDESFEIIAAYEDGVCPDCLEPIPSNVVDGQDCSNCGHVFTLPKPDDDAEQQRRDEKNGLYPEHLDDAN